MYLTLSLLEPLHREDKRVAKPSEDRSAVRRPDGLKM